MLRNSIRRGINSYVVGTLLSLVITILLSACKSSPPVTPAFIERVGKSETAVLLQVLLTGLISFTFGASSVIFEIDRWSFLVQGIIHFLVTAVVWGGVALLCWLPETSALSLSLLASFSFTYISTWLICYLVRRAEIRRINEQIIIKNKEDSR